MERIGQTVGSYRIVERVGEGGMGTVYRAVDLMLDREVALKAVRPELARESHIVERFRSEAKTLARINHPAIATIYSFFRDGDELFLAMEFVRGTSLAQVIRNAGAVPWERAVPLFCNALEGIEQVHRLGIIHRDLKPDNLMITEEGAIKVMDFGIARAVGSDRLTRTGLMMGTLRYMPPEQLRGEEADRRSDVYGLGTVLFEMLTGRVPFSSESEYEIIRAQVEDAPPAPGSLMPGLPAWLDGAVLRALAKNPADRFQTAEQFRAFLASGGPTIPETPEITTLPTLARPSSGAVTAAPSPGRAPATAAGSYGPPAVGRPRRLAWAAGLAGILAALVVGVWAARGQREKPAVPLKPAPAQVRIPAPAPPSPRQAVPKTEPPHSLPSEIVRTLPASTPVPPSRPRPASVATPTAVADTPHAAPPAVEPVLVEPSAPSASPAQESFASPPLTTSELQELGRTAARLDGATDKLARAYGQFVQQKKAAGQELTAAERQLETLIAGMREGSARFSNRVDQGLSTWPRSGGTVGKGPAAGADDRRVGFQRHARQLSLNGQRVNRLIAQVQPGAAVEAAWQEVRAQSRQVVEIIAEAGKAPPP